MKKSMDRILVLDGDHKNALAIVRHLGKTKQYLIDVVSYSKASVAFFSKYAHQKFIIHNPKKDPDKYIADLIGLLQQNTYLTLLPVSYISYQLCAAHKDEILQYTHLTIAQVEHINIASSKIETYQLAEKIGIPYPRMQVIQSVDEIEEVETNYPCVIKAPFELGKNMVEYAADKDELVDKYKKLCLKNNFGSQLPIIQKYIQGEGAGFFAFYKNGECKNYFIHRRIREYPVSGGASTCAESFYDESILQNGKKILDYLKWEGVAMVEFKKDNSTGIYNLMEINAKFWGSLDLALLAGINFPQMLIDDALGMEIERNDFNRKLRFQWILNGDLFHILERPRHLGAFMKDLFHAENDFYFSDIKPNLFQLLYIPIFYYKKWFK
jgi:predicted ATP-grasp superfamily ATP-dependent carboligase